jgi:antagonist of KipI
MARIRIIKPGLLTTVQDLGRYGYQKMGMPVSGAMDTFSLRLANTLLGNSQNEACLEVTAIGPEVEFEADTLIAICGGNMQPTINGQTVDINCTIRVSGGDLLQFKGLATGFRTYISFSGGIDVPLVMGSGSTYMRAQVGGYLGRNLKAGDYLEIRGKGLSPSFRNANSIKIPKIESPLKLRILAGPEANRFTVKGLATFLNSLYTISNQSDRMGYRLEGEMVERKSSPDIISSGIAFGTIQVPAHGQPIIMLADRQTTGGYARIANVITADLPFLAQLQPGDSVSFEEVDIETAVELLKEQEILLDSVKRGS